MHSLPRMHAKYAKATNYENPTHSPYSLAPTHSLQPTRPNPLRRPNLVLLVHRNLTSPANGNSTLQGAEYT